MDFALLKENVSILSTMKKIFKTSDKIYLALFVPLTAATFFTEHFTPLSVFTIASYIGWRVGRAQLEAKSCGQIFLSPRCS